ncbi:hypothetical protein SAMN05421821_11837 [Mucilaginibacter lappiensis]|uniref:Glycosyltransferase 2-like domain-containing protein n=1 Tax=Mucilaginibacter lappiensis TaxID=354630 RepID=A0ABR6PRN5_9SPHI|nr:glycosyltransferase family 2 protein [Mucilaginibacter lappiensis]MBB6112433.1 hypothetical protein [Mucilaginibacter lappiensis]SIS00489.1 hypothetical protein SAMN05421821_11837 [Mucilaginibacter lappiensis]
MDKVYVVVVNYKKYNDTIECCESVLKSSYKNCQILLIDNSPDSESSVNLVKWLNNKSFEVDTSYVELVYPLIDKPIPHVYIYETEFLERTTGFEEQVVLIKAENRGFAAANNIALKHIHKTAGLDSFIWILNNDTVVERSCMENLKRFFDNHDRKYIVGSKLMYYYQKDRIQAIAGLYNKWLGSTYHVGDHEVDLGQYDEFIFDSNNYVVGASMFISKQFIDTVGLMNEEYFLYFEEMDWGLTAGQFGFRLGFQPLAVVYHKEGSSIIKGNNDNKFIADYYSIVNRVKFTKKWYSGYLVIVMGGVVYALLKRLFKGKFNLVKKIINSLYKVLFSKHK